MPHKKFTGTVKIDGRARLLSSQDIWILIPYPPDAPIDKEVMEWEGRQLFIYLKDRIATITGEPLGTRLYNARVAPTNLANKDVRLAPESRDKFSREIEQYFKHDSSEIAEKLNYVGIVTISAFYHRIKNFEPEVHAFSAYLKVPETAIKQFIASIENSPSNRALITAPPKIPVARGINLKRVRRISGVPVKRHAPNVPPPFPASEKTPHLPSKVDLTKQVTRVKDQGPFRGTCVAHATTALLEYELIHQGKHKKSNLDLSEQYLYWGCKQIDGAPKDEGTFIEYAVEVLKQGVKTEKYPPGICREKHWPYVAAPIQDNESHNPPPFTAEQAQKSNTVGNYFKIKKYEDVEANSIKELKKALANNHCVGLSVYTYHFWTDGYTWREGVLSLPFQIEPDGAHAVCLVGYKDSDATHSDGYFIFKNSWGTNWGVGRPDQGFGSMPYRYVIKEAIEAWVIHL